MVDNIINEISALVEVMKDLIKKDIEDIKAAKHEKLLDRNDKKQESMDRIIELREELNAQLVKEMKSGVDINIYRTKVDALENNLYDLKVMNRKLAIIVLPIQQMYKDIVQEITKHNGGNIVEIKV